MKKILTTVSIRWEGNEPIRARVFKSGAKVAFEKGTIALADSKVAQALVGRYKKFVVLEEGDEVVTETVVVKPKKTKRVAKK